MPIFFINGSVTSGLFYISFTCQRVLDESGEVERWHLSRGHAQKNDGGKVIVWIGTHTDIH